MTSNRFEFIARERLYGALGGYDFGSNVWVVVRSPLAILLWNGGGGYWSGRGQQAYGASHLTIYFHTHQSIMQYRDIGERGGRLTVPRVQAEAVPIGEAFKDDELLDQICEAVKTKRTLLIEGGGTAPRVR